MDSTLVLAFLAVNGYSGGMKNVNFTLIDTACLLIDIGGFRIVTDPVLDEPGQLYHHGWGAVSRKTGTPRREVLAGGADLVLLSHHQHQDNLDAGGREFLSQVPLVLSTKAAARALPGVQGLSPWESRQIATDLVPGLRITATPAQHRPGWLPEFISGPVIGFVLEWSGQTEGCLYWAGDTVYFRGIDQVAERFKVDTAIFNVGGVMFPYLAGAGRFTMNGRDVVRATEVLGPREIVPIHHSGWSHFHEPASRLRSVLETHPVTSPKVRWLA